MSQAEERPVELMFADWLVCFERHDRRRFYSRPEIHSNKLMTLNKFRRLTGLR